MSAERQSEDSQKLRRSLWCSLKVCLIIFVRFIYFIFVLFIFRSSTHYSSICSVRTEWRNRQNCMQYWDRLSAIEDNLVQKCRSKSCLIQMWYSDWLNCLLQIIDVDNSYGYEIAEESTPGEPYIHSIILIRKTKSVLIIKFLFI